VGLGKARACTSPTPTVADVLLVLVLLPPPPPPILLVDSRKSSRLLDAAVHAPRTLLERVRADASLDSELGNHPLGGSP